MLVIGTSACSTEKAESSESSTTSSTTSTVAVTDTAGVESGVEAQPPSDVNEPPTPGESPGEGIDTLPMPIVGDAVAPVSMRSTAEFGNGVVAKVAAVTPVDIEAKLPGETSGPGVKVTVELSNGSDGPIDLSNVTADLIDAEGESMVRVDSDARHSEFASPVSPGAASSATYLFRIAPEHRNDVFLTIKYSTPTPTVIFAGSVAE